MINWKNLALASKHESYCVQCMIFVVQVWVDWCVVKL